MTDLIRLYSYWRSSAAYRVRIALNLKGLAYDYQPVHLLAAGGEQRSENYAQLNPQKLIPVLVDDGSSASRWPSSNIWPTSTTAPATC